MSDTNTIDEINWDDVTDEDFFETDVTGSTESPVDAEKSVSETDDTFWETATDVVVKETVTEPVAKEVEVVKEAGTPDDVTPPVTEPVKEVVKPTDASTDVGVPSEGGDIYKALAKDMVQRGAWSGVEIKDEDEVTAEQVLQYNANAVADGVKQTIEGWREGLGDIGVQFVEHTMNGGDPRAFLRTFEKPDLSTLDITTVEGQKAVVKSYTKHFENKDDTEATELTQFYEEKGKLEERAKAYQAKAKAHEVAALAEQVAAAKTQAAESKEKIAAEIAKVDTIINSGVALEGNFQFTEDDKKEIPSYMFNKSVKLENGKYISAYYKGLQEVLNNPEKSAVLAKLIRTGFDVTSFKKQGKTEKVKEIESNLALLAKSTSTKVVNNSTTTDESNKLSDFF